MIWRTEEVRQYIVKCYAGVEPTPERGNPRRMFEWEEADAIKRGNANAFTRHLGRRFGFDPSPHSASSVHKTLRDEGEALYRWGDGDRPAVEDRPDYEEPEPEEFVVRKLERSVRERLEDVEAGIDLMEEVMGKLRGEVRRLREHLGGT